MTPPEIRIRQYKGVDAKAAAKVYRDSVTEIGIEQYDPLQVEVWASYSDEKEAFTDMLETGFTLVAESTEGIVAFGTLNPANHVSLLYTLKAYSRMGIGSAIYRELERHAVSKGVTVLSTDASKFSRPLFHKAGFQIVEREIAVRKGVQFERYRMKKELSPV